MSNMITKVIEPSDFPKFDKIASLINIHRGGIDRQWLSKSAAVLTSEISQLRPEPGVQFIHVNALGDMEYTGYNRNGDGFPTAENQACHGTFTKYAQWYHNHRNKPHLGHPAFGFVKHAAYNPEMRRVELVVGIREKDDPEAIEKLARDEDLHVSMACHIAHDICSECGNKASRPDEYCDCIKKHCGEITKSGNVIGMINVRPRFFDISWITNDRKADRTAQTFRKIASADALPLSVASAMDYEVMDAASEDFQEKLAVWKTVVAQTAYDHNPHVANALNVPLPVTKLAGASAEDALGALERGMILPSTESFFRVLLGTKYAGLAEKVAEARAYAPYVWRDINAAAPVIKCAGHYDSLGRMALPDELAAYACRPDTLSRRAIMLNHEKCAAVQHTDKVSKLGRELAYEYAGYKLACATRNPDPFFVRMMVLQDGRV